MSVRTALRRLRSALWRRAHRGRALAEGQLWSFEHRTDPDARLLIQRITAHPEHGRIFHVVPFTPWLPILTNLQRDHAVFSMTEPALRRSIIRPLGEGPPLHVDDQIANLEALLEADEISLFGPLPLGAYLAVYRELNDRAPHDHPGAYFPVPPL